MCAIGRSGQRVRELWTEARATKPTILFIAECESIFGSRGAAETDIVGVDLNQAFLSERNAKEDRIWLIGATKRRTLIDPAILSRFT